MHARRRRLSASVPASRKAQQFDDLYEDERWLVKQLRPGLFRRRQLAVDTVAGLRRARASSTWAAVPVGSASSCSRRRAPRTMSASTSPTPMIDLARARLEGRFADAHRPDRRRLPDRRRSTGPFEVILAVGLFDYLPEPHRFSPAACSSSPHPAAAWSARSRPGRSLKGPIRKVRYEWIGDCPIFNYSRRELELMFGASGFDRVEIQSPGRSGYLVRAYRT